MLDLEHPGFYIFALDCQLEQKYCFQRTKKNKNPSFFVPKRRFCAYFLIAIIFLGVTPTVVEHRIEDECEYKHNTDCIIGPQGGRRR